MGSIAVMDEVERVVVAVNDIVVKDEMKRMSDTLEPLASSGTMLILSKEQVEKLEEHFLKDPFPSHSTLVALDSRLGLEEKHVRHMQDWFSVERKIKHKRGYHLYARGYHPYAGPFHRPSHSSWPLMGVGKELEATLKRLSTAAPEVCDLEDTDK